VKAVLRLAVAYCCGAAKLIVARCLPSPLAEELVALLQELQLRASRGGTAQRADRAQDSALPPTPPRRRARSRPRVSALRCWLAALAAAAAAGCSVPQRHHPAMRSHRSGLTRPSTLLTDTGMIARMTNDQESLR